MSATPTFRSLRNIFIAAAFLAAGDFSYAQSVPKRNREARASINWITGDRIDALESFLNIGLGVDNLDLADLSSPDSVTGPSNWAGGVGNWSNGAMWVGVGSPNSNTADVFIDGGNATVSQVMLDGNFTVGRLTIDADDTLSFNNGAVLNLAIGGFSGSGALVNNGNILIGTATGGATLNVANGSTLSGTGVITLSNNGNNMIQGTSTGAAFTIASGATIRGTGTFSFGPSGGTNMLKITNQGLIDASDSGSALNIRMESFNNTNLTNTGTLRASGGGTLRIYGSGNLFNTGGLIEALDGSAVRIANGITVEGGVVTTSGTGAIRGDTAGGSGGTLSNLINNGTVAIANGETLGLAGTFTNNGLVRLDSTGSASTLRIASGTTLMGSGLVTLSNNGNNTIQGASTGATFTIASDATIQGTGAISPGPSGGSNMLKITNEGLIDSNNAAGLLSIRMENSNGTSLTNTGTLRASNGGTLRVFGTSNLFNTGGVIEALDASTVRIASGITVEGGLVTTAGTGAIRGDTAGGSGGTLSNVTNNGTVAIANGETLGLAGTFTNNGLVNLDSTGSASSLYLRSNVTIDGNGSIMLGNNFFNQIGGDTTAGFTLTVASGATIQGGGHLGGNNNNFNPKSINIVNQGLIDSTFGMTIFVNNGASSNLTNSGTLRASNSSTLSLSAVGTGIVTNNGGTLVASSGSAINGTSGLSLIQNSGTIDLHGGNMSFPTSTTLNGGVLKGTGTFTGPIAVNANATVQGGDGTTGTKLTIAGALSLNNNSVIELTLASGGSHSTLARNGSGLWTFDSDQAFTFIDAGAEMGFYDNIITSLSANPGTTATWTITNAGWTGTFSYDGANIDLNVITVPEPSTWALIFLGICGLLAVQRSRSRFVR